MKSQYDVSKLTKEQKECLNIVESLGVFELRALARIFGGNSPTTQKRNDHIKVVMDKIIAKEEISPLTHKTGRPYKEIDSISGVLDELSHITGMDYTQKSVKQKKITFNQIELDLYSQNLFPIKAKGVVLSNENEELYFVNQYNSKLVLIDRKFYNKIDKYDFVEGVAVVMNSKHEYLLNEVSSVNFEVPKLVSQNFEFKNKTYPLASRYRFEKTTKLIDKQDDIKSLLKNLKEKGIISVAIIPNVAEEDLMSLQLVGFDCLVCFKISETAGNIYDTLSENLNFLKKQLSDGYNIALFIQDPVTISNFVDYYYRNGVKCFMGHTEAVANFSRELNKLIKTHSKSNSLTCFTTHDDSDMLDPLYVSLIYKNYKQI